MLLITCVLNKYCNGHLICCGVLSVFVRAQKLEKVWHPRHGFQMHSSWHCSVRTAKACESGAIVSTEHPTTSLWGVYMHQRGKWVLMGSAVFLSESPCCAGRQNLVLPQSALTHSSANTELHLKLRSCCPCRALCQATPQTRDRKERAVSCFSFST